MFYETFKEFGFQLAIEKTEIMMQKATPDEIREQLLHVVKKFK